MEAIRQTVMKLSQENRVEHMPADKNQIAGASPVLNPLPPLQDQFGRTFDYVRIAVTEKCNLRCT